ncbi:hypothetical protein JNB11_06705 [Kocuria palustris]|nr:hypothetical protein [Kocuria palustris]
MVNTRPSLPRLCPLASPRSVTTSPPFDIPAAVITITNPVELRDDRDC